MKSLIKILNNKEKVLFIKIDECNTLFNKLMYPLNWIIIKM